VVASVCVVSAILVNKRTHFNPWHHWWAF